MDMAALIMLIFLLVLLSFVAFFLKKSQRRRAEDPLVHGGTGVENETKKDLVTLEHHVQKLLHEGYSKEAIMRKLTALGWHEHLVDLVVYEVHKPHNRIKALESYVRQQLLKAKPKEIIKENLLSAGWDEEIVDLALGFGPAHAEEMVEEEAKTAALMSMFL